MFDNNHVTHRRSVSFDAVFNSHFAEELSQSPFPLRASQDALSPEKIQQAVATPVSAASSPLMGRFKPSSSLSPADNGRINEALVKTGLMSLSPRIGRDIKQYDQAWQESDSRSDQIIENAFKKRKIPNINIS